MAAKDHGWRIRNAVPIYFSQACAALMPFVVTPMIIRNLGIDVFGTYATLMTASQVGLIFSEYSFDAIGPRLVADQQCSAEFAQDKSIYEVVLSAKMPMMFVGFAVSVLVFWIITNRFPRVEEVVGIGFVIVGTALLASWYLLARGRILLLATLIAVSRLLTVALTIGLIVGRRFFPHGSAVLFLAYAAPIVIVGASIAFRTVENPRRLVFNDAAYRLLKRGCVTFLGNSGAAIQNVIGSFAVGLVAGPASLGIYNAIDRPARMLSTSLKPVFQTLYPHMALLHRSNDAKAHAELKRYIAVSIIAGGVVVSVCLVTSKEAVTLLYGQSMAAYHHLLSILICWLSVGIVNNLIGIQGLLAAGRDADYSRGILCGLAVTVVGTLIFARQSPYTYWVGASIVAGEFGALLVYWRAFSKKHAR